MNKINSILRISTLIGVLIFLIPNYASAEAGKGITDESIVLLLITLVLILVNQVFLIITSIKKIIKPKTKLSVLHYISLVIGVVIFIIYLPHMQSQRLPFFELFITLPFLLGMISFLVALFNWVEKRK